MKHKFRFYLRTGWRLNENGAHNFTLTVIAYDFESSGGPANWRVGDRVIEIEPTKPMPHIPMFNMGIYITSLFALVHEMCTPFRRLNAG